MRSEHERQVIKQDIQESGIPDRYINYNFKDYKLEPHEKTNYCKRVKNACVQFAEGEYSSLILAGKNGTGKTMLACCMLRHAIINQARREYVYGLKNNIYTEAIKLVRFIKSSWKHPDDTFTEQEAIDKFTKPELLVIDEIGMQYGSQTESQFITEIINDRYNRQKRTIIAGNVTVGEIEELLGSRIVDRFRQNGKVLVFDWDSYRNNNLKKGEESCLTKKI